MDKLYTCSVSVSVCGDDGGDDGGGGGGGSSLITHSFKPCVTTSNQKSQVSKTAVPLKST